MPPESDSARQRAAVFPSSSSAYSPPPTLTANTPTGEALTTQTVASPQNRDPQGQQGPDARPARTGAHPVAVIARRATLQRPPELLRGRRVLTVAANADECAKMVAAVRKRHPRLVHASRAGESLEAVSVGVDMASFAVRTALLSTYIFKLSSVYLLLV